MGNIQVISDLYSPKEKIQRTIRIYTPDSYNDRSDKRYPVLYMTDGQNIYSDYRSARWDTWCVNPTIERIIAQHKLDREWIICGIDHTVNRFNEYTPWPCPAMKVYEPAGGVFLETLTDLIMPWMKTHYKILDGAQHTALAGSSLGGLISLFCGRERPDLIGRIGAFSPSLGWSDGKTYEHWQGARNGGQKIYLDMGSEEKYNRNGEEISAADECRRFYDQLIATGYHKDDVRLYIEEGGIHYETSWAKRFPVMCEWLLNDR